MAAPPPLRRAPLSETVLYFKAAHWFVIHRYILVAVKHRPRNCGWITGRDETFLSSSKLSDRLLDPQCAPGGEAAGT